MTKLLMTELKNKNSIITKARETRLFKKKLLVISYCGS